LLILGSAKAFRCSFSPWLEPGRAPLPHSPGSPKLDGEMKDQADRISELERHCEALENAIQEIREVIWEPKATLPQVKHRVATILVAVKDRKPK
jgi:uncharacterized coiled-coil protein SlyX